MTCHACVVECKKAGKRPDGLQRYRCAQCGKTFSDRTQYGVIGHKQIDDSKAILALKLLVEGNSVRSTERITGLEKRTILKLLVNVGERCQALLETKVRNVPATDIQADELWTFVGKKKRNRRGNEANFTEIGDAWIFVGIERNTKLVLAHELGNRTVKCATRFMHKIALATDPSQKFQLTTDGLAAYNIAVGNVLGHQGERVDYAQLIKIYTQDVPEEVRRYSPPRLAEAIPTPIYGDPDERKRLRNPSCSRQRFPLKMARCGTRKGFLRSLKDLQRAG